MGYAAYAEDRSNARASPEAWRPEVRTRQASGLTAPRPRQRVLICSKNQPVDCAGRHRFRPRHRAKDCLEQRTNTSAGANGLDIFDPRGFGISTAQIFWRPAWGNCCARVELLSDSGQFSREATSRA